MKLFEDIQVKESFPDLKIEQALSTVIHTESKQSNPALSPSGMHCQRAAAFKLSGSMVAEGDETYESGLPASMGSFIHERIQKFMSLSPIWVDVKDFIEAHPDLGLSICEEQKHIGEVSLEFSGYRNGKKISPPFRFQCDGIVKIDEKYYIIEIKTEMEMAWQKREAPNIKHKEQAVAYSFLYDIDDILWIYASRESFGVHRKVYLQTMDKSTRKEFQQMCMNIGNAVDRKDIRSLPKSNDCRYCPYKQLCKDLDK